MGEDCRLREANGLDHAYCEGEACVFWRVADQAGLGTAEGCAVQYFQLLGDEETAAWLLSVKERVERTSALEPSTV